MYQMKRYGTATFVYGFAFINLVCVQSVIQWMNEHDLTRLNLSASCEGMCLKWVYMHLSQLFVNSRGTHYGTSWAATLLVENIDSSSLLEIQDNNNVSGSAYKNLSKWKYSAERQSRWLPKLKNIIDW